MKRQFCFRLVTLKIFKRFYLLEQQYICKNQFERVLLLFVLCSLEGLHIFVCGLDGGDSGVDILGDDITSVLIHRDSHPRQEPNLAQFWSQIDFQRDGLVFERAFLMVLGEAGEGALRN